MLGRLIEYVGGMLRAERCRLLAAGGMPDHTHWLVALHQGVSVSGAVMRVKSCSSGWIHETFPRLGGFAWQAGYGAFTVSHSNLEQVRAYILDQAVHHRTRTFQEEYLAFLKRHEISYDERYVWD
ncbi:MAG: transposase [Isosphaeraceae bacterium]